MRIVSSHSGWYVTALHGLFAVGWFVAMPGGFSMGHPRFWVNRALPLLLAGLCVVAAVQGFRGDRGTSRAALVLLGTFWAALVVATIVVFPASAWRIVVAMSLVGAMVWLAVFLSTLRSVKIRRALMIPAIVLGAGAGVFVPLAQRASAPGTRPLNEGVPALPAIPEVAARGGDFDVHKPTGQITLRRRSYVVMIDPLLTFASRSPDRCWTNLASKAAREGPGRRFVGESSQGESLWMEYADDDRSVLQVNAAGNGVDVTAWSHLPVDVYSHLNSFSRLQIDGHAKLEMVFSPCDKAVEPHFQEYPVGAPAQCAAMFEDGRFDVLKATTAEKGPFQTLATGKLGRGDPLTITFRDQGRDVLAVTWLDFASQAGADLSPTAGYGLPVNAIEFSLYDNDPASAMGLYMTLAGTSVGRGWDSVGHAAGTYRNRMQIRWLIE